jgi:type II secretory pathway pseudopilin PulG
LGLKTKRLSQQCAFTLVEVLVAAGVTLVGFAAVMLLNSTNLGMVKSAR